MTAIAVLVCLIIITMIAGAALKIGLARRQELREQEHRLQAEWLAEAGIQRGLARLASDARYDGETWEISGRELDSPDSALVTITVERPPGDAEHANIRAKADYPRDQSRRARETRSVRFTLKAATGASDKATIP